MDYRLDENCSTSTQTTEGESDRDYTYEEGNGQNFKWTAESFDDFCRELNLSKVLTKRYIAMLKVEHYLKIKLSTVSNRHINERSKDVNAFLTNFEDFDYR